MITITNHKDGFPRLLSDGTPGDAQDLNNFNLKGIVSRDCGGLQMIAMDNEHDNLYIYFQFLIQKFSIVEVTIQ